MNNQSSGKIIEQAKQFLDLYLMNDSRKYLYETLLNAKAAFTSDLTQKQKTTKTLFIQSEIESIIHSSDNYIATTDNSDYIQQDTIPEINTLINYLSLEATCIETASKYSDDLPYDLGESGLSLSERKNQIIQKSINKRRLETARHQLFVDVCLKPRGYKNGENTVFAIIHANEENCNNSNIEEKTYRLSLLTPAMAYTDHRFFFEEFSRNSMPWWHEEYRPYYYDLLMQVPTGDSFWQRFHSYYYNDQVLPIFEAKLYKEKPENNCPKEGSYIYKGVLRFGGSDSFEDNVYLEVNWETIFRLYNSYRNADDQIHKDLYNWLRELYQNTFKDYYTRNKTNQNIFMNLESYLNDQFKNINKNNIDVDILNVGQANCIHFKAGSTLSFMFDIGVPFETLNNGNSNTDYENQTGNINKSIAIIKKYKPNFVIISHYHTDHMIGFIHMNIDGIKNSVWITPNIDNNVKDLTCIRFALYKAKQKKLIVIEDNYGCCLYDNPVIRLFRGRDSNDLNDSSFILLIKKNTFALFSGDCRYPQWPDSTVLSVSEINQVEHLVVPHHGSKNTGNAGILSEFKASNRKAYICCGQNDYEHPSGNHLHKLNSIGGFDLDNIILTGGTLVPTSIDQFEFSYNDNRGITHTDNAKIQRDTISFTL